MAEATPAEPELWRERARRFAEKFVVSRASEIDRTDRVPPSIVQGLVENGFFGVGLPPEWDGRGGDTRATVAVLEELARGSAAVAVLVAVHLSVCAAPILQWGTGAQKERYLRPLARGERIGAFGLTEPGVGSDTARLSTRYRREVEGGFVLDGTKMFISNAASAGVTLVFATSDPTLGHRGISAFVVPSETPGFSVAQRLDKLGLRGSETTELVLKGVRLGPEALLGPEGSGLKLALGALSGGRVGIAGCALGVAQAAFEEMLRSVRRDPTEASRHRLAQMFSSLASARALVDRAARSKDAALPFVSDASVAKLVASRAAVEIASAAIDVAGPEGTRAESVAGRLWRDARVFPIVEGTTEIQELILARDLLEPSASRNP